MKDTKPTLIIISPGFARNEQDSTCLPAQQVLIKTLNKNYPELQIIILAIEFPFHHSTYQWYGNTVIGFNAWKKNKLKKVRILLDIWRTLKKLQQQHTIIGVLNFWCNYCALIGKYFAKSHRLIHYSWILGQDAKKDNRYIRWIKPTPDELIALSDFAAATFYKNHQVLPQYVIPFGIDPSLFSNEDHSRDIDILGAGSLIPLKQYDIFIRLIGELTKTFPTIKTIICGKGPDKEKLQALIVQSGLEKNISLLGERPHEEVLQLMQRTKIFLHPSLYEGFGVVCTEALYAGAHVISFCKPMNATIHNWHIVKNEDDMLQKAVHLLQNDRLEHAAVMPYSTDDCSKKLMALFNYHTNITVQSTTTEYVSQY